MWWWGNNLDKPIFGSDQEPWHFQVWHGRHEGVYTQRIFFWNEPKTETGLIELKADQTIHVSRIKARLKKIALDPTYRTPFLMSLEFPLERHW